ncbi:hypothetical protein RR46_02945 [Papilio xuthus]|uniref:Secreted protein n=1 Tax=Papilio xuthus TaxID=66420 RepID=A0A194Q3P4_PAPXU|nr:hypothetical protein RR46_02945 [Papilio xuthus]
MVRLGLAMVVGVAPALVSWWRGQNTQLPLPLVSPVSPDISPTSDKVPRWPQHRSPSISDCLPSSSDEESARSIVCHVRPKIMITAIRFRVRAVRSAQYVRNGGARLRQR